MKSHMLRGALAATLAIASTAYAQNTRTGYFNKDYTYGFMLNPAMENDKSFVAVPGLGNLDVSMSGTLHVSDVIYNVNGKTTTFLNPGVSAAEALKNIGDRERVGVDLRETVLAGGFKAWGGYNSVAISVRGSVGVKLPGELLRFVKEGITNDTYDIGKLDAYANAYAEILFGHSRRINSEWRVGGNFKVLLGAGNFDIRMKDATVTLGENDWTAEVQGSMSANVKNLHYKTKVRNYDGTPRRYVDGLDYDSFGLGGWGLGIDLGAVYSPKALPDWQFSASILDLGFISWSTNMYADTDGLRTFSTNNYTFNPDNDAPNSFEKEWDRFSDDLKNLYQLRDEGDKGHQTRALAASFNLGAEYTLPVYRKLTFGLLNTTRMQGTFSWTDFRLSANVAPCKVFSASISGSAGTYGVGFGWLVNVHGTGGNFFLGMDRTPGKLAKQGVPLNSNMQVNLGWNVLF